jgi:hypothetical protein
MNEDEKQARQYSQIFIDNFHSGLMTRFALYEWALTLIISDYCAYKNKRDFVIYVLGKFNYQKKYEIFVDVMKSANYFDKERTSMFFDKISTLNAMRNLIAHSSWNIVSVEGDNPQRTVYEYIRYGKPKAYGLGEPMRYTYSELKNLADSSVFVESEIRAIRAIQIGNTGTEESLST